MIELTPSQKGAAAEAEIAAAALRMRLQVLRPIGEGGRYDLAIDIGEKLLRVQCKWASRAGDVLPPTADQVAVRRADTGERHTQPMKSTPSPYMRPTPIGATSSPSVRSKAAPH